MDKVTSKATGKVYARKRIHRKKMFGYDTKAQKVYENELKTLKKVGDHEHLIKVRGTYTDRKYMVMLLQPVADENLKQYMSREPLLSIEEQARFRTYFGCLAHTIRFLHDPSIEVLHKDIKPENVLLKSGHLILTDFGTAFDWSKTGQSMTQSNAKDVRTPRYQSPEAALGEFHRSSDIWSLGVVFFEMVTFLRGKTLAEMDAFLQNHGQGVTSIHNNIEGAMNWFEQLQAYDSGSPIDNEPLTWIKPMLNRVQSNRPTAVELFENVVGFQDGRFCGHCCMDTDSSSDEGFESDMEMLSDIMEHDEPNVPTFSGERQDDHTISKDQTYEQPSPKPSFNNEKTVITGILPNANLLSDSTKKHQTASQRGVDNALPATSPQDLLPSCQLPDEPSGALLLRLADASQISSKTVKIAEGSSSNSQKVETKPRSKTFWERDTFIQYLAGLPEKFAPPSSQHRSRSTKRPASQGLRAPSVETQRIEHFLSSLPEETTEFDDLGEGILPFKSSNRSRTMPVASSNIKRSNSQEDFQSSSHLLHEENDEDQFAEVGKSRLVHYASDGALNPASAVSKEALQEVKRDLKEFAATIQLFDRERISEAPKNAATNHPQSDAGSARREDRLSAGADPVKQELLTEKARIPKDMIARTGQDAGNKSWTAGDQKKQAKRNPNEKAASAKSERSSKTSTATKPPRLGDFKTKAPPRRGKKFESANVIMERILDDKSSEAPTSIMSVNTRAAVSVGRIGLRWNDKAYGYLPKFVANGKVGAVRECLKAGCNPGREQKPRWAPVYNAVRGASDKHLKCLRALVSYGADVNARRSTNGRTPLHYAVESEPWPSYSSVIYTLLAAGADPNVRDWANDLPLLMLLVGNGPLSQEKRDALFLLLAPNFNTDLNVSVPGTLDNPLHLAIRRKDAYTVDAILEKMRQVGGSALDLMHEHNGSGFTPILLALTIFQLGKDSDEELQIIKYLLKHGASANDADTTQGKTPLHLVIGGSKSTIALELLCRHSANPNLPDLSGQTAKTLVRKLRADYPQDSWYRFAARRMDNRLTTEDYRPSELKAFLAEERDSASPLTEGPL